VKLLGTVRLSHETDESTSPVRQREQIKRYAELYSHQVITITEDLDISGSISPFSRPQLGPWLIDPDKLSQYDAIIVAKVAVRYLLKFSDVTLNSGGKQADFGERES
jgi:hypothetical protein